MHQTKPPPQEVQMCRLSCNVPVVERLAERDPSYMYYICVPECGCVKNGTAKNLLRYENKHTNTADRRHLCWPAPHMRASRTRVTNTCMEYGTCTRYYGAVARAPGPAALRPAGSALPPDANARGRSSAKRNEPELNPTTQSRHRRRRRQRRGALRI